MENKNAHLTMLGNNNTVYKDQYDPSLIELIEREPRRQGYSAPMNGYDIWTAFEASFLLPSGIPAFCVLRITNPADSKKIFESKSLKLYLNSFNNTILASKEEFRSIVSKDLTRVVGSEVMVFEAFNFESETSTYKQVLCLENILENRSVKIDTYTYSKELLKIKSNSIGEGSNIPLTQNPIRLYSDLLRSNCEITNQPDWGRVFIDYTPADNLLDYNSILKYIISYRNHQEFHEPTCERIYNDLFELLNPRELTVICQYTRRGGIDINIWRSTKEVDIFDTVNLPKLLQQ